MNGARVARSASRISGSIVTRVHETNELVGFLVQKRIRAFRIGARRMMPSGRVLRQHMGCIACFGVLLIRTLRITVIGADPTNVGRAAMAIRAPQDDTRIGMHRRLIGFGMTVVAPYAFGRSLILRLLGGCRWRGNINPLDRLEPLGRGGDINRPRQQHEPG